jgi:hypothetical protein
MSSNVVQMPLRLLKTGMGTQQRQLNLDTVNEYAELMKEGRKFKPLEAVRAGNAIILWHGFHRYHAAKQAGLDMHAVAVREGTADDAIFLSLGANKDNGLQRTAQEINGCIRTMLTDQRYADLTHDDIAEHIGCSRKRVGKIQKAIDDEKSRQSESDNVTPSQNETSQGDNSKNTSRDGDSGKKKPDPKEQFPTDKVGKRIPNHLIDIFSRRHEITTYMNEIDAIRRNVEQNCEAADPLWFYMRRNPLQTEVGNLKRIFKYSLPYAVCPMHGNERPEDAKDCKCCKGAGWITEELYRTVPAELKK